MATQQLNRMIQAVRTVALPQEDATLSDRQLLDRYVRGREEAAFAALVHRHGPMVWGVCRRILHSHQDAEDAFQATFLVLVRKAAGVRSVANWLYGVAHQTALSARASAGKRRMREKQVTAMPEPAAEPEACNDLRAVLDRELTRLPAKYREAIVLCDLEGKTRHEAAEQLGLPGGTVATRLATARAMLAKRLAKRGTGLTGVALAAALAQTASAGVPASVASSTIKAATLFAAGPATAGGMSIKAVALAEGVLRTMLLTKLKIATVVLGVLLTAGGFLGSGLGIGDRPGLDAVSAEPAPPPTDREANGPLTLDDITGKMLRTPGNRFEVIVEGRNDRPVSGTGTYFYDSCIATAAVHMGLLKPGEKAVLTLTVMNCPPRGVGSTQNGVTSQPWDSARAGDTAFVLERLPAKGAAQVPAKAAPAAEPAPKAEPPAKAEPVPTHINGTVKAVDAQNRTVTVTDRGGEAAFSVAQNAEIQIDDKRGELAALPVGAVVNLRKFVDARTAGSVHAEGRWCSGVVKAIDVATSTLTYSDFAQDVDRARTFNVPAGLPVSIDGKRGKFAAIPVGASVNLQLMVDQVTVRSLSAEGMPVNGTVKAVDAAKRTVTVNDTTYPVATDAHISLDHKPGKLEDLPAGANVGLSLQVDQRTVHRISANGSSDFGQVKAVDAANSTITVTGGPPNDRVYQVPADAPIFIDGQPGSLAAIPVGASLHALNLRVDQKTVSSINVVGPSLHHVGVQSVDPERRTITLGDKEPPAIAGKTLAVAADANIEVDGKPGKLTGIPAGAFLNLGLSVDGLTARHIQAEGPNLGGCGGSCVSAVDAANSTITFDEKGPPEVAGKTFTVARDVWLQMDARPGKLADLPVGSYLNITLTVDQQLVRSIWAVGPPVPGIGVVNAVDAEKRTITVDNTTYPVASNANIVIDNRGGLAAVPIGANVTLRLCVDQRTVGTIAVQAK
jgi:RNA polymerase sigma factor (sigma-70 family)